MVTAGAIHLLAVGAGLVLLAVAWMMFSGFLKPRAASLDLQDMDVLQPDRNAVRMFVANSVMLLLSMVLVTTAIWSFSWQVAVACNIAIIFSVMAYMKYIHLALKVKPPPIRKEHILHPGPAPRASVGPYFGPRRERIKVEKSLRAAPSKHEFKPVPKSSLIPAPHKYEKGKG
jgi:hypothetical protein